MQIEERRNGSVLIIQVVNQRLDARMAPEFKERLVQYIQQGNQSLVLDLSFVDFVDSSGLGALVSVLKRIGPKGDLVIVGVRDSVLSMFKLTRMDKVFRMFTSEQEAISAFSI